MIRHRRADRPTTTRAALMPIADPSPVLNLRDAVEDFKAANREIHSFDASLPDPIDTKTLSLSDAPVFLRVSFNRLQRHYRKHHRFKVPTGLGLSLCTRFGLERLLDSEPAQSFLAVLDAVEDTDGLSAASEIELDHVIRKMFKFEPDSHTHDKERLSFRVPEHLSTHTDKDKGGSRESPPEEDQGVRIFDGASLLRMDRSELLVPCMAFGLACCQCEDEDHPNIINPETASWMVEDFRALKDCLSNRADKMTKILGAYTS